MLRLRSAEFEGDLATPGLGYGTYDTDVACKVVTAFITERLAP